MEITKPNDILVATINNPGATTADLKSLQLSIENTGLLSKDDYKSKQYIKDQFTDDKGKFNELSFNNFYDQASQHYNELGNDQYFKDLETIEYSPFDLTRPIDSKTFSVNVEYSKDFNPFKKLYGTTSIYSTEDNNLSLRELAQTGKVFDPSTNTWSEESANDLSLFDKWFGDTLVYGQWDEDGVHIDAETQNQIKHHKGDWKTDSNGNLFLEKLAGREIYGKQVVNPTDLLTTDGSLANQFDFMDSDSRQKSIPGIAMKTIVEIAPFLIPGGIGTKIGTIYGGLRAGISLASVLPTFYKSLEGILLGDTTTKLNDTMNSVEGYMSKFVQSSYTDEAQTSMFSGEQLADMVGSIFSQIYEQRAMASLSKLAFRGAAEEAKLTEKYGTLVQSVQKEAMEGLAKNKLDFTDFGRISKLATAKVPELKSLYKKQSQLSKALSLGYMALTSTSNIYGDALTSGYDRRTAGFASLLAATGQYGIMMNNRMGDWFLDKTTGYTAETNKALISKAVTPYLGEIEDVITKKGTTTASEVAKKAKLAGIYNKFKTGLEDIFLSPSELVENLWKKALIEGTEEVTEQAVLDMTKGVVDTMSYLGLTSKQGSFGGWSTIFSEEGVKNYISNFIGGVFGGALFEFNDSKLSKILNPDTKALNKDTRTSLYDLVASGHENDIIDFINNNRKKLGNAYISPLNNSGVDEGSNGVTQADFISDTAIKMIKSISAVLDATGLKGTDSEILKRAILDDIIIGQLNDLKESGKNIGIEGLILNDFKTYRDKATDLQLKINEEEKAGGDTKNLKEELSIYTNKIKDILSGKNAGEYFDKMMILLNQKTLAPLLNIDRNSYVKNTYGKAYIDLPDAGLGITKERIDKEWDDLIQNKDLSKHLNAVTGSYLEWEKSLNKPIAEFSESGYSEERAQVYNTILDLKGTLESFNTSGTPEERSVALDRFYQLSEHLKKLGVKTQLPWNIYKTNFSKELLKEGLIKKVNYVQNAEGNFIPEESDATEEELQNPALLNSIDSIFNQLPGNALDPELGIAQFNLIEKNRVEAVLKEINTILAKPEQTEEDAKKLNEYNDALSGIKLIPTIESNTLVQITRDFHVKRTDLLNKFASDNGIENAKLNSDLENYAWAQSNTEISGDFNEFATIQDNQMTFNKSEIEVLDKLLNSGVLLKSLSLLNAENTENFRKSLKELLSKSETEQINLAQELIDNNLVIIQNAINLYNNLASLKENANFQELKEQLEKLNSEENKNLLENKPKFYNVKNYLTEFLLNHLEKGLADEEIYNEAKKSIEETKNLISEQVLGSTGDFNVLIDLLGVNNILDYFEGTDPDENLVQFFKGENSKTPVENHEIPNSVLDYLENLNLKSGNDITIRLQNILYKSELYKDQLELINRFNKLVANGLVLKKNPLYNFIRNFSLSLNSNSKTSKIIDIIEKEENGLLQASSVSNYTYDGIRDTDIKQALTTLQIIKAVINAMSTTQISYSDPTGFIYTRQQFAKRNKIDSDINNLKTITSDLAAIMSNDIDLMISKLGFLKTISDNNSGRSVVEQETIRKSMTGVWLEHWDNIIKKLPLSFLPKDKMTDILNQDIDDEEKLNKIEDIFYDSCKDNKEKTLDAIMNLFSNVSSDFKSRIDREVDISKVSNWDTLMYLTSTLVVKGSDWLSMNYRTMDKFDKAPFYVQELAARVVRASTINPNLFEKILNKFYNTTKINTGFITFVLGGAGTGKTTSVFGLNLNLFRLTNEKTILRVVAPTELQTNNLNTAIQTSVGEDNLSIIKASKNKLYEDLNIGTLMSAIVNDLDNFDLDHLASEQELKDYWESDQTADWKFSKYIYNNSGSLGVYLPETELENVDLSNLPNLLLIDEVTHFSFAELKVLNEISKKSYYSDSSNFMKIIASGDPNQLGYFINNGKTYYQQNVNQVTGIFTPKLFASIRSNNNQKRANSDFLIGMIDTIAPMYREDTTRVESETKARAVIVSAKYTLEYFHDRQTLNGDLITKEIKDNQIESIANAIKNDPKRTLGILTSAGEINSEIKQLLEKYNIPEANIKLFTPRNVQGSEVDYFIFNAEEVTKFDTTRDKLKAFYTFESRSKRGTLIIDPDNQIEENLNIINTTPTPTQEYESLSHDVIEKAKADRKIRIEKTLGGKIEVSQDANFKWLFAKNSDVEPVDTIDEVIPNTVDIAKTGFYKTLDKPLTPTEDAATSFTRKENSIKRDNFKLILYSFYKNINAIYNKDTKTITRNVLFLNSDLSVNTHGPITEESFNKLKQQWLNLKNEVFNEFMISNKREFTINSDNYSLFLAKAFESEIDFKNTKSLDVKIVVTTSRYNENFNKPYNKSLDNPKKHLKNSQLFINLSGKITFNGKSHFVTLATFPAQETLAKKALNKVIESDRDALALELFSTLDKLETNLKNNEDQPVIYDFDATFEHLTGVRLLRGEPKSTEEYPIIKLSDLSSRFEDADFSEIKLFPAELEQFSKLLRENYFDYEGQQLSDAQIQNLYSALKNKPYVRVTFGQYNSNLGKLVPVYGISRDLKEVQLEVADLLNKLDAVLDSVDKGERVSKLDYTETNLISDTILNKSNVLDLLIHWGLVKDASGNALLDKLTKEHPLKNELFGKKSYRVIDFMTRLGLNKVSANSKYDQIGKLIAILNEIKGEIAKNPKSNIKEIKDKLLTGTHRQLFRSRWHEGFQFIFGYESIINKKSDLDFAKAMKKYFGHSFRTQDEDFNPMEFNKFIEEDSLLDTLGATSQELINNIPSSQRFYYSIPIVSENKIIKINPNISGKGGFDDPKYSKFFIRTIVESPNTLTSYKILNSLTKEVDRPINIETPEEVTILKNNLEQEVILPEPTLLINWDTIQQYLDNITYNEDQNPIHIESYLNIVKGLDTFIQKNKQWCKDISIEDMLINRLSNISNPTYDNVVKIFTDVLFDLGIKNESVLGNANNIYFYNLLKDSTLNGETIIDDNQIRFGLNDDSLDDLWENIDSAFNKICN